MTFSSLSLERNRCSVAQVASCANSSKLESSNPDEADVPKGIITLSVKSFSLTKSLTTQLGSCHQTGNPKKT